jgi:hypothetical protein
MQYWYEKHIILLSSESLIKKSIAHRHKKSNVVLRRPISSFVAQHHVILQHTPSSNIILHHPTSSSFVQHHPPSFNIILRPPASSPHRPSLFTRRTFSLTNRPKGPQLPRPSSIDPPLTAPYLVRHHPRSFCPTF